MKFIAFYFQVEAYPNALATLLFANASKSASSSSMDTNWFFHFLLLKLDIEQLISTMAWSGFQNSQKWIGGDTCEKRFYGAILSKKKL